MKTPSSHSFILHTWVGLLVLVVTSDPCDGLEPPNIIARNSFVTVKVGKTLQLICHGDEPLQWRFTHVQNLEYRYSSTESNGTSIPRPYSTTFTLTNITHYDVGEFTCLYNNTDGEHAGETSVYLYVDDEENLLVDLENGLTFHKISAMQGGKAWIPCRPTSLHVTIQIKKGGVPILLDSKYDPKIGYVIDSVVPLSAAWYSCIARRGNAEKIHNWRVYVTFAPEESEKWRSPRINAKNDGAVGLGSNFTLECVTEQEDHYYRLNWTQPVAILNSGRASFSSRWARGKPNSMGLSLKNTFYSKLTIRDARKEDAGEYVCVVRTFYYSAQTSKTIRIYEDKDRFLNVTTSTKNVKVKIGETAQWTVNISTYPNKYGFARKKNSEIEISNNKKFFIYRSEPNSVVLAIKKASLEDAGSYQFEVQNLQFRELLEVIQLNLDVLHKPKVVLEPKESEEYFQEGRNYSAQCIAHGFPLPNVAWFFQETLIFGQKITRHYCSSLMMKPLKGEIDVDKHQQTISTLTFTPTSHGILRCRAENSEGVDCLQKNIKIVDFPCDKGFGVSGPNTIVEHDSIQLICSVSKLNATKRIEWIKKDKSGETTSLENVTGIVLEKMESQWSWKKTLTIRKINKGQSGEYLCLLDGDKKFTKSFQVQVKDQLPPIINDTNLNETTIRLKDGYIQETKLFCRATGVPTPRIQWTKDGLDMNEWPEEIIYNVADAGRVLTFPYLRKSGSGKYECTARNRNGTAKTFINIQVEGSREPVGNLLYLYLSVPLLIGLLIVSAVLTVKMHKEKLLKRYLEEVKRRDFFEGAVEELNPELGIEDQANLLPYDTKWEFPRRRLHLGILLGFGTFGRVTKADAYGIIPGEICTTVAVKMVKETADETHFKALMSELKIMIHLGQHLNVVNLLGASTEFLIKKELLVIVEYCKYGSLLSYMHRHRHTFINQLDNTKEIIDPSIYNSINRTSQQSQLANGSLAFTDTGNNSETTSIGLRALEELNDKSATSPTSGFENNSVNYDNEPQVHILDTRRQSLATADYDGDGSNKLVDSLCQDHYYTGDYQNDDVQPIKTTDILCWAFQISRGMDYLASRKVLHGDLAARNVLLAENNIVKICDFGLAKQMYKDYKYQKKSEGGLMPVKWMAIESIYYGVFSTKSDIWSFGVVLWELFTLGKTPYPGMKANEDFYKMLNEGYRMEKPSLAPSSIYELMIECWTYEPSERPSFPTLVHRLGNMMEESVRQLYLRLNVPYDNINRDWLSKEPDYLSKMGVPDFQSETCRPTPEREFQNVSNNEVEPREHFLVE